MKQSTSNASQELYSLSSTATFPDEKEREVAKILLDLPHLISKSVSLRRFPFSWGVKRRRSALDSIPPPPPPRLVNPSPSQSSERTPQDYEDDNDDDDEEFKTEKAQKANVEASSPATPLLFSPSESDEKLKHSQKKISKRRTREDWLEIVEKLTLSRDLLRGKIETVKCDYNKLRAINLELKAKKQQLCFCIEKERNPKLGNRESSNLKMELGDQGPYKFPFMVHHHQQPLIVDQTARVQYPSGLTPHSLSGSGMGLANQVGPHGIPDLNVSAAAEEEEEETSTIYYGGGEWEGSQSSFGGFDLNSEPPNPIEHRAAKAAEARKRRMIRIKEMKKSFVAIKPPPPHPRFS